jgi:hypothetical protein
MHFNLTIGYRVRKNFYKDFYEKSKQISKNKNLEISIYRDFHYFFRFSFGLSFYGHDHAGPRFEFSSLGFNIDFKIYDSRHWDYVTNNWKVYD